MYITICVGSSCHLKGSREIIEGLDQLIKEYHLENRVELNGCFCMGECMRGVCVKIEEIIYSLDKNNLEEFFHEQVLRRISG